MTVDGGQSPFDSVELGFVMAAPRITENPFVGDEYVRDPHPTYRRLRELGPVVWSDGAHAWILTTYATVKRAFIGPAFQGDRLAGVFDSLSAQDRERLTDLEHYPRDELSFASEDTHGALRLTLDPILRRDFSATVEASVSAVRATLNGRRSFDVVGDYAQPITERILPSVLGIRRLPDDIATLTEQMHAMRSVPPPTVPMMEDAQRTVTAIASDVAHAEKDPTIGDDGLFALLEAAAAADSLAGADVAATEFQLMRTAHAPSTLISTVLWRLMATPGVWDQIREHPDLIPSAIEEVLRLEPPSMFVTRTPSEPVRLDGVDVAVGDRLILAVAAANRDPAVFDEPDDFRLGRDGRRVMSFSRGQHACPGQHLGRAECVAAVEAFVSAFPEVRPDLGSATWKANPRFRQLASFVVELGV